MRRGAGAGQSALTHARAFSAPPAPCRSVRPLLCGLPCAPHGASGCVPPPQPHGLSRAPKPPIKRPNRTRVDTLPWFGVCFDGA